MANKTEKEIGFRVTIDDKGSAGLKGVNQELLSIRDNILSTGVAMAKNHNDTVKQINEQLRLYQQLQKVRAAAAKEEVGRTFTQNVSQAKQEFEEWKKKYGPAASGQTLSTREAELAQKITALEEGKNQSLSGIDKKTEETNILLRVLIDAVIDSANKEVRLDKDKAKEAIEALQQGQLTTAESQARASIERDQMAATGDKKDGSTWEKIKKIAAIGIGIEVGRRTLEFGSRIGGAVANARGGEEFMADIVSEIPFIS